MKVKFGKLEVELVQPYPEWEDNYRADIPGGFKLRCFKLYGEWIAQMDGPWYDDSNPEGIGVTIQEAMSALAEDVLGLCYDFYDLREAIDDTLP